MLHHQATLLLFVLKNCYFLKTCLLLHKAIIVLYKISYFAPDSKSFSVMLDIASIIAFLKLAYFQSLLLLDFAISPANPMFIMPQATALIWFLLLAKYAAINADAWQPLPTIFPISGTPL